MNSTHLPTIIDNPSRPSLGQTARRYLTGRHGLFALAATALTAGLALNWSWLVAAGIAPLLISVLPCVAMCALGLCMNRMAGRECATDNASGHNTDATPGALPPFRSEHPGQEKDSDLG
jgi:hypothetical protein